MPIKTVIQIFIASLVVAIVGTFLFATPHIARGPQIALGGSNQSEAGLRYLVQDVSGNDLIHVNASSTIVGPQFAHTQITLPTVSGCGTGSPAVSASSTDNVGRVTTGNSPTTCLITFYNVWLMKPVCFAVNDSSTSMVMYVTTSVSSITIGKSSAGTIANGSILGWVCEGYR